MREDVDVAAGCGKSRKEREVTMWDHPWSGEQAGIADRRHQNFYKRAGATQEDTEEAVGWGFSRTGEDDADWQLLLVERRFEIGHEAAALVLRHADLRNVAGTAAQFDMVATGDNGRRWWGHFAAACGPGVLVLVNAVWDRRKSLPGEQKWRTNNAPCS